MATSKQPLDGKAADALTLSARGSQNAKGANSQLGLAQTGNSLPKSAKPQNQLQASAASRIGRKKHSAQTSSWGYLTATRPPSHQKSGSVCAIKQPVDGSLASKRRQSKKLLLESGKDSQLGKILNLSQSMIYVSDAGIIDKQKSKIVANQCFV